MSDVAGGAKEVNGRLVRRGERDPIAIGASGFRIGRDPLSELIIADSEVSRLHAEIRYEGGRYVLYDFSSNGTWVNGELVAERRTLRAGDAVKIGGAEFRFLVERAPAGTQTPPLPPAGTPPVRGGMLAGPTMRRVSEAADARPGFLLPFLFAVFERPASSSFARLLRGPGVLILGDHRQSLAVARSLCRAGYRVIAGRSGRRTILESSRYVAEVWDHPPESDPCAWVEAVEAFCAWREDVGVIFPVGEREIELLAPLAARLPVLIAIVDPAVLAICRSKRALLALADEVNVPTLRWEAVDDPRALECALRRVGFPAVLKPDSYAEDTLGFKAMIVHSVGDARRLMADTEFPPCGFVVQRLARGMRYNLYFVAHGGRLLGHAAVRILRTDRPDGTGLAVEGESVPPSPALVAWTRALTERLSYTGIGCAQFMVEGKTASFLEINARLGANGAAACACGLDLPRLFIEACLGIAKPQPSTRVGRRYAWLYGDLHGLALALQSGRIGWAEARRWLARTALSELRARDHVTWSWRDPLPTFALYGRWFLEFLRFVRRHALGRRSHKAKGRHARRPAEGRR